MRVLINANLGWEVAACLSHHGHQSIFVQHVLGDGAPDSEVARFAVADGRHILTLDARFGFELLASDIHFPHALVTLDPRGLGDIPSSHVYLLEYLLAEYPDWRDMTHYVVSPHQIRIRPLSRRFD